MTPGMMFLLFLLCFVVFADAQNTNSSVKDSCDGIYLSYPFESNSALQSYAFTSNVTVVNTGDEEIRGSSMPANVNNGTVLSGFPQTILKTAIETTGDLSQIQAKVGLSGTEFDVGNNSIPIPTH